MENARLSENSKVISELTLHNEQIFIVRLANSVFFYIKIGVEIFLVNFDIFLYLFF